MAPCYDKKTIVIGTRVLSVAELKEELLNRTPIGLDLMKLHHRLYKRLRTRAEHEA